MDHDSLRPENDARQPLPRVRQRIHELLDHGAPWEACDLFRDAIVTRPGDAELLYCGALAHARAGAAHVAHALLDEAQAAAHPPSLLVEILSLRGRLWKDAFHRAPGRAGATQMAARARDQYLKAYSFGHDAHPGINAATLSMLLGDATSARRLAREIIGALVAPAQRSTWDIATEGEAQLLLGDVHRAADCYAAACRSAGNDAGIIATMRRQLNLLTRAIPEASTVLPLLRVPDVVAFAGHMVDTPDRATPRFPPALVPVVCAAIERHVAHLHQPIIFSSAACGADLLFLEAALEQEAEVNVVLPFDRNDFVRTSVAVGGDDWVRRFDAALARATRIIMATDERYLGDDSLFEHAAKLVEGFSMLRAAQLETSPSMLCVIDGSASGGVGGTRASHERWQRHFAPPDVIDLAALRVDLPDQPPTTPAACEASGYGAADRRLGARPQRDKRRARRPQRSLKTLMFADFAGFSHVQDAFAPQFHEHFLNIGAAQIAESAVKPLDAKTWGDGLYVVFESAQNGAEFALRFLERTLDFDWTAAGLSPASRIRIALHAGPVFRGFDPIMRRHLFFGSSVTRAARIEPVTQPGTVYASEAFAATLAATGQRDFTLEYVGRLPLAKAYGESRIYRLDRA